MKTFVGDEEKEEDQLHALDQDTTPQREMEFKGDIIENESKGEWNNDLQQSSERNTEEKEKLGEVHEDLPVNDLPTPREDKKPQKIKKGGKKKKGATLGARSTQECKETSPSLRTLKKEKDESAPNHSSLDADSHKRRIEELEKILTQREEQLHRQAELLDSAKRASDEAVEESEAARAIQSKLAQAEQRIKQLLEDKKELESKVKGKSSLEHELKVKDSEIKEIMQEGEALSKKQLQMETSIKQLRADILELQTEVQEKDAVIETDKERIRMLESSKENLESMLKASKEDHQSLMQNLKSEHEKTVKELRAELIAVERKMESMEKAGSSRKLRDAETKCEALQNSIESIREEMRRQRQNADEREDMLSAEISMLQEKCSEAEVRQQDFENKLTQATSPLLAEIDILRKKLEDQEQRSISAEKKSMDQTVTLEMEKQEILEKLEQIKEIEEETRLRCEGLQSQLISAQQASVESERIASDEKAARDKAETLLREAKSELAALEKNTVSTERVFYSQLEVVTAKEATLKETIRGLEEEVRSLTQKLEDAKSQSSNTQILQIEPMDTVNERFDMPIDDSEDGIRRKIKELESTREHLSNELVKAEQRLAEGNTAKMLLDSQTKEISDLRRKLAAATELLGEREERIEELHADLEDVRQGYKQQLVIMADEVSRLTKKEKVVEEFLS